MLIGCIAIQVGIIELFILSLLGTVKMLKPGKQARCK